MSELHKSRKKYTLKIYVGNSDEEGAFDNTRANRVLKAINYLIKLAEPHYKYGNF